MKKFTALVLVMVMLFALAACGGTNNPGETTSETTEPTETTTETTAETEQPETSDRETPRGEVKTLIVYFSETGNTDIFANYIYDEIGGDMVRIIPTVKYPETYNELADYAKAEQDNDERPAFEDLGVNPEDYDVIYVGYPIWWYSLPMIMQTFFDTYNFAGKTIVPFNTHEGSRSGGTYDLIRELEPDATVLEGLPIRGGSISDEDSKQQVIDWLAGLEF